MKLFGKKIRQKTELMEPKFLTAEWWVHNQDTDLEFAECSECAHEVEPGSIHHRNGDFYIMKGTEKTYPAECPNCGARIYDIVPAETVDAETVPAE